MALPVVNGATTMCTMGIAPGTLNVVPKNKTMAGGQPAANIMDNVPMLNLTPFGLCNSLANPITAAQTAAAFGVLTPGTCTPVIPAPWTQGSPTVLIANMPALNNTSTCICAYGGQISIMWGGVATVTVA